MLTAEDARNLRFDHDWESRGDLKNAMDELQRKNLKIIEEEVKVRALKGRHKYTHKLDMECKLIYSLPVNRVHMVKMYLDFVNNICAELRAHGYGIEEKDGALLINWFEWSHKDGH